MSDLGVNLYLLHQAGARDLPAAAATYGDVISDVAGVAPPTGDFWGPANEAVGLIFSEAKSNMTHAGNVLRLIAYAIAATDTAAAEELKRRADFDEIPTLGPDGHWSDEGGN